jgi:hypothetical protein
MLAAAHRVGSCWLENLGEKSRPIFRKAYWDKAFSAFECFFTKKIGQKRGPVDLKIE